MGCMTEDGAVDVVGVVDVEGDGVFLGSPLP